MRHRRKTSTRAVTALLFGAALVAAPPGVPDARAQEADSTGEQARAITVKILGMSCPFCAYGVEQKLKELGGVEKLDVELESGLATLTMEPGADVSNDTLRKTVDEAGFEAAAVVRSFESEYEDWHPERIPDGEEPMKRIASDAALSGIRGARHPAAEPAFRRNRRQTMSESSPVTCSASRHVS